MKNTYLNLLFIILFGFSAPMATAAEATWNLVLGGANLLDRVLAATTTQDGGYILLGETIFSNNYSGSTQSYNLFKVNAAGEMLWSRTIFKDITTEFNSVIINETVDRELFVSGVTCSRKNNNQNHSYEVAVMKLNYKGRKIWQVNSRLSEQGVIKLDDIKYTKNGGVVMTISYLNKYTDEDGETHPDADSGKILYIDTFGKIILEKIFDVKSGFHRALIHETKDNNFLIAWVKDDNTTFLLIDKTGRELGRNVLENPDIDMRFDLIRATGDDNYILAGAGSLQSPFHLLLVDAAGHEIWWKVIGDVSDREELQDVNYFQETKEGDYIAFLRIYQDQWSGSGTKLFRVDGDGNVLWCKRTPVRGLDESKAFPGGILQTEDSDIVLAASIGRNAGIALVKLDHEGNQIWYKEYDGAYREFVRFFLPSVDGGFLIAADTESFMDRETVQNQNRVNPDNIWLIKTDAEGNAPATPEKYYTPIDFLWAQLKSAE